MKWVCLGRAHINTDQIQVFYWDAVSRELVIWYAGDREAVLSLDPDRELYTKLCHQLGVRLVEVGADGEG